MSITEITSTQLKARVGLVDYVANFADAVIQPVGWIDKNVLYWCLKQGMMPVEFSTGESVQCVVYNTDKSSKATFNMQKLSDFEKSTSNEIARVRAAYDELKTTHASLQAGLQRATQELSTVSRELYDAHSTIANMTDTIGTQEEAIKRHVYDKDAMESTFILLNSEVKAEHDTEIRELRARLIHDAEHWEEECKLARVRLAVCEAENDHLKKAADLTVSVVVNPTWTCPCCIEEFTPSHDSIICINALCNVRMCMGCIRKLPIRREHIKCPYCRIEYKIETSNQVADLKKQIYKLHAKCDVLVKMVNAGTPCDPPVAQAASAAANEPDAQPAAAANEPDAQPAAAANEPDSRPPVRMPVKIPVSPPYGPAGLFPMPPMPDNELFGHMPRIIPPMPPVSYMLRKSHIVPPMLYIPGMGSNPVDLSDRGYLDDSDNDE